MSKRADEQLVDDIREALRRIESYVGGMAYAAFVSDIKTQDAVVRNLEILGEAAKSLSEGYRSSHPAIPWKSMAGARDRLIHHYFGVNMDIIWEIAKEELPEVAAQLDELENPKE